MEFLVHASFKLNQVSFSNSKELVQYSKTISDSIHSFLNDFFDATEVVYVQTSGSTGVPKQIALKKEFMINSALATGVFFDLKKGASALLCMNPDFIAGKMMLVRAMVLGWKLDVVEPSLTPLKASKKKYDFSAMVPLQVHHSLNDLHLIDKLIIGGGVISKELESKLQEVSTSCFATYGMTETVTHIAVRLINNEKLKKNNYTDIISSTSTPLNTNSMKKSHYKVLPNVSVSIDNRNCLVIDAPKIAEEKVITNDIVELISDSEFKWLGRYDTIINSGGIKLIPEQIEEKLSDVIPQRFFVTGRPDKILGEKLVLVVELISTTLNDQKSGKVSEGQSLEEKLKSEVFNLKSLTKYEQPKEIYFLEQFVETDTKKIQRKKTSDLLFPNS